MTDNTEHRDAALAHMDYANAAQAELARLRDDQSAPHRHQRIAALHQDLGHVLKLAHIEATLDVAAALRERRPEGDPAQLELISLPGAGGDEPA